MKKEVLLKISENERDSIRNQMDLLGALESLTMIVASNNYIMIEDSELYKQLVLDYKECKKEIDTFWNHYLSLYSKEMPPNTQLTLDYDTCEISISAINNEPVNIQL